MTNRHGVLINIPEDTITEIGEDEAWRVARQLADRKAARYTIGHATRTRENDYRQNYPTLDPETGEALPPMRSYRFEYTDTGDTTTEEETA